MAVKVYDPAQVHVIFNGILIEGIAKDTFVLAERTNDMFSVMVGADGEGARAKTNDTSGTVTVTLMQSSISNDALSAIAAVDELTGDGVGALLVKDGLGRTILAAESAWIKKIASVEYGSEITNREWVFETDDLQMFVGGN